MIDMQCQTIAELHVEHLGSFMSRKLVSSIQKKEAEALAVLRKADLDVEQLRRLWVDQCATQTSAAEGKCFRLLSFCVQRASFFLVMEGI